VITTTICGEYKWSISLVAVLLSRILTAFLAAPLQTQDYEARMHTYFRLSIAGRHSDPLGSIVADPLI